jgi:hypothetical protein
MASIPVGETKQFEPTLNPTLEGLTALVRAIAA